MGCYGQQILQFVVVILEGGHAVPIKEQALCLVANIADGNDARNYIMNNEDVLRKIMNYMLDTRTKLQVRDAGIIYGYRQGSLEKIRAPLLPNALGLLVYPILTHLYLFIVLWSTVANL